jgi:hypothetical protein
MNNDEDQGIFENEYNKIYHKNIIKNEKNTFQTPNFCYPQTTTKFVSFRIMTWE